MRPQFGSHQPHTANQVARQRPAAPASRDMTASSGLHTQGHTHMGTCISAYAHFKKFFKKGICILFTYGPEQSEPKLTFLFKCGDSLHLPACLWGTLVRLKALGAALTVVYGAFMAILHTPFTPPGFRLCFIYIANTGSLVSCSCHNFYLLSWHFSQSFIRHFLFQPLKFLSPASWELGYIQEMVRICTGGAGGGSYSVQAVLLASAGGVPASLVWPWTATGHFSVSFSPEKPRTWELWLLLYRSECLQTGPEILKGLNVKNPNLVVWK